MSTLAAVGAAPPRSPATLSSVRSLVLIRPARLSPLHGLRRHLRRVVGACSPVSTDGAGGGGPGLYSAVSYDLTAENVDRVLDGVRPYLISDGGDVTVVGVEEGVVSLKLQGACESCPSSTTTMKMGIERVLREKFGNSIAEIRQVFDEAPNDTTAEAVNNHLEILRPAIANYGGSVEVLSVDGEVCHVKYDGPESIGSGIKAAIKEKFPEIVNVLFTL